MSADLSDFLKGLATDPDKLAAYLADPEASMSAAGLCEADKDELRTSREINELGYSFFPIIVRPTISQYVYDPPTTADPD